MPIYNNVDEILIRLFMPGVVWRGNGKGSKIRWDAICRVHLCVELGGEQIELGFALEASRSLPLVCDKPTTSGVKRPHSQLTPEEGGSVKQKTKPLQGSGGTKRPSESYAVKSSLENLAIVRLERGLQNKEAARQTCF